jgi:hypothetical protein
VGNGPRRARRRDRDHGRRLRARRRRHVQAEQGRRRRPEADGPAQERPARGVEVVARRVVIGPACPPGVRRTPGRERRARPHRPNSPDFRRRSDPGRNAVSCSARAAKAGWRRRGRRRAKASGVVKEALAGCGVRVCVAPLTTRHAGPTTPSASRWSPDVGALRNMRRRS